MSKQATERQPGPQRGRALRSDFSLCAPSLLFMLSIQGGSKRYNWSHFPEAPAPSKGPLPGPSLPETGPCHCGAPRETGSQLRPQQYEALPVRVQWGVGGATGQGLLRPGSSHSPRPHLPQMRISFSGPDVFPRQMLHLGSSPGTPAERKRPSGV